jgi:phosphatidylglycerophosphate synthase
MLRIFIAAAFFASLSGYRFPNQGIWCGNMAIVLFALAATTDFVDGYLARKWDVVSMFGRLMDPFCDKVLVLGAFIYLAGPRFLVPQWVEEGQLFDMATGVYPWMVVAIIARELLVTSIRDVLESMGHSGGAKWAGKFKMILQSIAIPVVLLLTVNFRPDQNPGVLMSINILVWSMLIITIWSGLPYVAGLMSVIKNKS